MGLISRVSSRTYRTNASDNLVPSNLLSSTMPEIQTTFSLNLGRLSTVAVLFPLTALIFSVVYSIVYDFDRVISSPESPCKGQTVVDYLPSVTACFSKFYPQTWVWWIGMAIPLWPRIILPKLFFNFHTSKQFLANSSFKNKNFIVTLSKISYYADIIDVVSLTFISYVVDLKPPEIESGTENKSIVLIHAASFGVFLVSSQLYILCTTILHSSTNNFYSNKFKKQWLCCSYILICIGATVFFFYKQLNPCQDMLQTYFAFFEYGVCGINLWFHLMSALDFGDYQMTFLPGEKEKKLRKSELKDVENDNFLQ